MPNSFSSFKISNSVFLFNFSKYSISNCNFLFFRFDTSISVGGSDFSEKKRISFSNESY
jgi:hypothetical protein